MKRIVFLLFLIIPTLSLSAKVSAPSQTAKSEGESWQAKTDTIWPARHYRELNGEATGDQMTKAWIDWKHPEGTVLVYGIHFPTGHVRADAVFKAKSGKNVTFGVRIVHPLTRTVVLETSATSNKTTTAEQTMEIMPDTEMPYDGWYRFELTCPDGQNTLDRLEVMKFQRTSTLTITDSEIFMAPSVHLWWGSKVPGAPSGEAYNWTYLEAMYPSAYRHQATYQMVIGTDVGYSGIQMPTRSDGSYGHSVLFSVWDEGDVDADRNLPDYMRAAAVDIGPDAYATRFGGEGTGSSIRFNRDDLWQFDRWIQFLLNERPENTVITITDEHGNTTTKEYESTLQSMWYKMAEEAEWHYIGTLRRTGDSRLTAGIYSFLENFGNIGGNLMHRCYFRNGAMRTAATGEWYPLNYAGFGNTQNNGNRYSRYDFGHGVTGLYDNAFYLETGGYMGTRDSANVCEAPVQGQMPWVDTIDIARLDRRIDLAVTHNRTKTVDALIEATRTVSDPTTWKLIQYSDEETVGEGDYGRAAQIMDGNTVTYYHNKWKNGSVAFPHTFSFDAGKEVTVSAIELYQSRDNSYRAKQVMIYTSDDGTSWNTIERLDVEDSERPTISLSEPVTARYFRLRFTAGYGSNLVINELYFKHEYRLADLLALAKRLFDEADQFGGYAPADLEALRTCYADGTCSDMDALRQAIKAVGQTALPLTYSVVNETDHFTPLAVYQLHNIAGRGDLIATADGKPSLAGSMSATALEAYRQPCSVTDPLCNWMILRSEKYHDYYLYNLGTQRYLHIGSTAADITLSETPVPVEITTTDNGYVLRNAGKYLIPNASTENPFLLSTTAGNAAVFELRTNYALRPDENMVRELAQQAERAVHEDNNPEYLFQQGLQTYSKAFVAKAQTATRLIRNASFLTSNCNTTQQEVHNLAKLIDQNKNTYYETWYSGINWPADPPYLQARFSTPFNAFSFSFTPSQNPEYGQPDIPVDIIVSASPTTRNFLTIARLDEGLPENIKDTYTSPVLFTDGNTRNLRFQVMRTYGQRADSRVWAMSEFQVHAVTIDETASPYHLRPNVRETFDALQAELQAMRQRIDENSVTAESFAALRTAIDNAEQALTEPDGIIATNNDGQLQPTALYDLSGRQVSQGQPMHKGVYILKDGKGFKKISK